MEKYIRMKFDCSSTFKNRASFLTIEKYNLLIREYCFYSRMLLNKRQVSDDPIQPGSRQAVFGQSALTLCGAISNKNTEGSGFWNVVKSKSASALEASASRNTKTFSEIQVAYVLDLSTCLPFPCETPVQKLEKYCRSMRRHKYLRSTSTLSYAFSSALLFSSPRSPRLLCVTAESSSKAFLRNR